MSLKNIVGDLMWWYNEEIIANGYGVIGGLFSLPAFQELHKLAQTEESASHVDNGIYESQTSARKFIYRSNFNNTKYNAIGVGLNPNSGEFYYDRESDESFIIVTLPPEWELITTEKSEQCDCEDGYVEVWHGEYEKCDNCNYDPIERIKQLEDRVEQLEERIDTLEQRMSERFDGIEHDLFVYFKQLNLGA